MHVKRSGLISGVRTELPISMQYLESSKIFPLSTDPDPLFHAVETCFLAWLVQRIPRTKLPSMLYLHLAKHHGIMPCSTEVRAIKLSFNSIGRERLVYGAENRWTHKRNEEGGWGG